MLRIFTVLAIVLGAAAALIFLLLENPDKFKNQMSEAIAANTDYEVQINGGLSWRYWPPIAIQAEDISLARQGEAAFAQFSRMEVDVDLLPLLTQRRIVDINLMSLQGGKISFIIDQQGVANWRAEPDQQSAGSSHATRSEALDAPTIHEFTIEQLELNYKDQRSTTDYTAHIESLHTSRLAIDAPFDVSLVASLTDHSDPLNVKVNTTGELVYRSNNRFGFNNLVVSCDITKDSTTYPEFRIVADGEWHPERQAIIVDKADISLSSLQASITGLVNLATESPQLDGVLMLESADLRQLGAVWGFDSPVSTLQLSTGVLASSEGINLTTLEGRFDASQFKGKAVIAAGTPLSVNGDLRLDQLNTAPYLEDESEASGTKTQTAATASTPADVELIPVSLLQNLNVDAIIRVDQLTHETIQLTGTKVEFSGDTKQFHLIANTHGFNGNLVISLDTELTASLGSLLSITLDRVDITSLSETQGITGTLSGQSNLQFSGTRFSELNHSLTGKSVYTITDGTLDVTPIKRMAATIDSLRGKQSRISTWPDIMPFEQMVAQHIFNNGMKTGQVFNGQLENLKITALGGIDLTNETLDYHVTAMFEPGTNGQFTVSDQLAGIRWPIDCKGSISDSPADLCFGKEGAINDLVADIARQDLKRRGNEKLEDLIEEKVPEELKELTRDLFKGLFK